MRILVAVNLHAHMQRQGEGGYEPPTAQRPQPSASGLGALISAPRFHSVANQSPGTPPKSDLPSLPYAPLRGSCMHRPHNVLSAVVSLSRPGIMMSGPGVSVPVGAHAIARFYVRSPTAGKAPGRQH